MSAKPSICGTSLGTFFLACLLAPWVAGAADGGAGGRAAPWQAPEGPASLRPDQEPNSARLFDMGHAKTPVWPGFTRVTVDSLYDTKAGFGWINENPGGHGENNENLVGRVPEGGSGARRRSNLYPDDLVGDYVFWRGGKKPLVFRVDVPDGDYRVWVYSAMNGSSIWYCSGSFSVTAAGTTVYQRRLTRETFLAGFYRETADQYEWRPGHDLWAKYLKEQTSKPFSFTATANGGSLQLAFHMPIPNEPKGLRGVATSLLPINAIMICPAAEAGRMEKKLLALDVARRDQFVTRWKATLNLPKDENRPPVVTPEYQAAGAVPFVGTFMDRLLPTANPRAEQVGTRIDVSLAQGQREAITFGVRPLEDLQGVTVSVTPPKDKAGHEIGAGCMDLHWVRYLEQPLDYRRATCEYRPLPMAYLKNRPLDIPQAFNRQWVLTIKVPADAAPGDYEGAIAVQAKGRTPLVFPLKATVYPFKLETYPDDDERIWIYNDLARMYLGVLVPDEAAYEAWVDRDLAFMKEHFMAPTLLNGYLSHSLNDYRQCIRLVKKHGFRGYTLFRGSEVSSRIDDYGRKPLDVGYKPLIDRFRELLHLAKEEGVESPLFYFTAEIHTGQRAYDEAKRAAALFKKEIPGIKLLALTMTNEEFDTLVTSEVDVIGPNALSMTAENIQQVHETRRKLWEYAWGRDRFRCGYNDWRIGNRGSLREWYTAIKGAPFNPFDSTLHDAWNDSPPLFAPEGVISTPGLEETAAGRTDFFYLATLDLWRQRAKDTGLDANSAAVKAADGLVAELHDRLEPEYTYYYDRLKESRKAASWLDVDLEAVYKWKNSEFEFYRRRAAQCIIDLKKALKRD